MTIRRNLALAVAALAVPVVFAACSAGGSASPSPIPSAAPATPTPAPTQPGPTQPAPSQLGSAYPAGCPTAQPAALAKGETRTVTINTDKGDIVMKVEADLSPIAAGNFVALAECAYYDGVIFHRVIPGFMIQGGDGQFGRSPDVIPGRAGTGGPPYTIQDEPVTGTYTRGTVAMAKTQDPNSAGSQFFIVHQDLAPGALDPRYQIFGHVTSGMEVVDAIAAAADKENPTNPVVMNKVTVSTP